MPSPDYSQKAWTRNSMRGKSAHERFEQKIDKSGECWIWLGARTSRGYGVLRIDGQNFYVHRLALEFDGRPLADSELACHTCDTPLCVKPAHIYAGSARDNSHDAVERGRLNPHRPDPTETSAHFRRLYAEHPERHHERAKTHCPHGHEYTPDNTYRRQNGKRHCRTCVLAQNRAAALRRKQPA